MHGEQGEKRKCDEGDRSALRRAIAARLYLIEERDRQGARGARDIAAKHKNNAELAYGVAEAKDASGEKRPARQREDHARKDLQRRRPKDASQILELRIRLGKGGHKGGECKGETINERTEQQAAEAERERVAEQGQ